jgi:hypothetical protein
MALILNRRLRKCLTKQGRERRGFALVAAGRAAAFFSQFSQKATKATKRYEVSVTKGKNSAAWKFGASQHQSLRYLCDLL